MQMRRLHFYLQMPSMLYIHIQIYDEELAKVAQKWTMTCPYLTHHDKNNAIPGKATGD